MSKLQYISLSQLMSSVEDDFHKWSDAGLVDQSKYIKIVRECNEKLGVRIYNSKHIILYVTEGPEMKHGRADLPADFYKMEMAFALHRRTVNSMLPIGPGMQQVMAPPTLQQIQSGAITNTTGCCLDAAGDCSWLIKTPLTQLQVQINDFIPLEIFEGSHEHFTEYSPNRGYHHQPHHRRNGITIHADEGYLETDFHEGVIYMSYLADMKSESGEIMIPFHSSLNEYYEWAIKTRILQNILYNNEADVAQLYKDAQKERNFAFHDAVNFVMGKEYKEWSKYEKERSDKFFRKYYQIFY